MSDPRGLDVRAGEVPVLRWPTGDGATQPAEAGSAGGGSEEHLGERCPEEMKSRGI